MNFVKRKWVTLLRVFSYGALNFFRNAWLSVAATAVMTLTLLIIIATFTAQIIGNDTIQALRQRIYVSVYLNDSDSIQDVESFAKELQAVPIVTTVQYISKDEAQAEFVSEHQNQLTELQALGEISNNPFPASLRVKTVDPNKLSLVEKVINDPKNIHLEDLSANQQATSSNEIQATIATVGRVSQFAEDAGLVLGVIFVVISVMIIFNTIRMAIFNRRDEIEIMKLIGAGKSFIRGPFIVEAAMYGMLAAIISLVLMYGIVLSKASYLSSYVSVGGAIHLFRTWPVVIILAQIGVGMLIGIFSALLAMRRYLRL